MILLGFAAAFIVAIIWDGINVTKVQAPEEKVPFDMDAWKREIDEAYKH